MKQAKVSSQWKVPLCVPTRLVEKLARKFPERFGNRAWFQILVRNRALDPSMAGKREDKWSTTKPLDVVVGLCSTQTSSFYWP